MDRRTALQRVALLLGGTLSSSALTGILGGCRAEQGPAPFVPKTLTPDQNELVTRLAELIIPTTDTPGAEAAGVNRFIDTILTDWFEADERDAFLAGLARVDEEAQSAFGKSMRQLTHEEQVSVLSTVADGAEGAPAAGGASPAHPPFFTVLKGLTIVGYYTSEIGASEELRDMPFGTYDGSVPYEEIGRSWS